MTDPQVLLSRLWAFIRGDEEVTTFEPWLYEHDELEALLGTELYLEAISTPFRLREEVDHIRTRLEAFARAQDAFLCECVALPTLTVVDMGHQEHVFRTLEPAATRGEPCWWLTLDLCRECEQAWLVATEERQNDVYILQRISVAERDQILAHNVWPPSLDSYEALLIIGKSAGRSVQWIDPMNSSAVRQTIIDLAEARPGIGLRELAELLNLEPHVVRKITHELIAQQLHVRLDG